jgi:hypothetical protein
LQHDQCVSRAFRNPEYLSLAQSRGFGQSCSDTEFGKLSPH